MARAGRGYYERCVQIEEGSGEVGVTGVAVGRPILFGAAVGGADGVKSVIDHLRQELQTAMLLAGAQSVDKIGRDYLKLQPT
jgi:L-lactate oxidase